MTSGSIPTTDYVSIELKSPQKSLYKDQLNDFCYLLAQIKQHGFSQEEINFYTDQQLVFQARNKGVNHINIEDFQNYFLTGDVPMSGAARYSKTEQVIKTLKSADFEEFIREYLNADKLVHLDSASVAYSPDFTLSYVLNKLHAIDTIKTVPFVFKMPKYTGNQTQTIDLTFPKITDVPSQLVKSTSIDETIQVLNYKNGLTVILHQNESDKALFKMIGNGGLNLIPQADRAIFSGCEKSLVVGYGNFSYKEIFNFERTNSINLSNDIKDFSFSNTLQGNSASFEKLCQVFNAALVNPTKATEAEFLKNQERANSRSGRKLAEITDPTDSVESANNLIPNAETQNRLFDYRGQILRNFSNSVLYISGNLPANAQELVTKYIASIPVSKPSAVEPEINATKMAKGIVFTETKWKRESSLISYLFERKDAKKLTVKDELMLEAIAELGNVKMLDSLREKHGLVYSTGETALVKKYPVDYLSLNLRYMIEAKNIPRSKELMLSLLLDLKQGRVADEELEHMKALIVSKYLTGFFDTEQMEGRWLMLNLKYGTVFSWNQLNDIIASITPAEIKKMMSELFDFDNYTLKYFIPEK